MRRTTPIRIGDLWNDFIKSAPTFALRLAEAKVSKIWSTVAGNRIAMYTTAIEVKRGTLYISISSATARNEAFMHRSFYQKTINETLGMEVVKRVIVR